MTRFIDRLTLTVKYWWQGDTCNNYTLKTKILGGQSRLSAGLERGLSESDMGSKEERARFMAWWEATGGGNISLRAIAEQAFTCGARLEQKACVAICREVAERYPTDVFPEDGQSLDCKSARMARLTAENIERGITERGTGEKP